MDTTETYLNLGSEQFNSWVNEYENKYNAIEKKNISSINSLSSDERIDEYSSPIRNQKEKEIDTEDENDSESIFIKRENAKFKNLNSDSENDISTNTQKKRLLYNPRVPVRKNYNSTENERITKVDSINSLRKSLSDDNNILEQIKNLKKITESKEDMILSLKELNQMLPNTKKNIKTQEVEKIIEENKVPDQSKTKIREKALYKFMMRRR
tara:strand:- start:4498 stop:5130 length:633 start_codon:yes stop_codon:yes gene_type:complete